MKSDEELAALWCAAAPPDEEAELRRLARRMRRLAPVVLWGELVVAILLAGIIGLAIVTNLGPTTMLAGCLVLLLLAWSAWTRHRLGSIALLIDEGDMLTFIRSTVRAKEAEQKRSALEMALVVPGIVLTMILGFTLHRESGKEGDLLAYLTGIVTTPRGLVVLGFFVCAVLVLVLSHLRLNRELGHLRRIHEEYEAEARLDGFTTL